jgi:DNA replication factor GINS
MNVEELRSVQRTERQKDSLQHLRDSFYRDVADYIAERKAERERVAAEADDPFSSPDVSRLTDEIETAEAVVESVYERRVGKIVKRATFAAAGMATEDEGLTSEERDLFEDLVARIEANRGTVLDGLVGDVDAAEAADASASDPASADGSADSPSPDSPSADAPADGGDDPAPAPPDPDDLLAEAMGGETADPPGDTDGEDGGESRSAAGSGAPPQEATGAPSASTTAGGDASPPASPDAAATDDATAESADLPRTTLRITRDVGEILGVDEREYDLASEDVVTLPTPNAEPLLDRDAAERLDDE